MFRASRVPRNCVGPTQVGQHGRLLALSGLSLFGYVGFQTQDYHFEFMSPAVSLLTLTCGAGRDSLADSSHGRWPHRKMLAPSRHGNAEQERDKQARQRCFPGNGADGGEWLSRLPRGCNRLAEPLDRGLKAGGKLRDRARHVSGGIDGAFRHTGLQCWFGGFYVHWSMPTCRCSRN